MIAERKKHYQETGNVILHEDEFDPPGPMSYTQLYGFNTRETDEMYHVSFRVNGGDVVSVFKHPKHEFLGYMKFYAVVMHSCPGKYTTFTCLDEKFNVRFAATKKYEEGAPETQFLGRSFDLSKFEWIEGLPKHIHYLFLLSKSSFYLLATLIGFVNERGERWQPFKEEHIWSTVLFGHLSGEQLEDEKKKMQQEANK